MTKTICCIFLLCLTIFANGQRSSSLYKRHKIRTILEKKELSFQVAPTIIDYQSVKFGYGIGVDYKHWVSLKWFTVRDYNFGINYTDNAYSGLHLNLSYPITNYFDFVLGMRLGKMLLDSNNSTNTDGIIGFHPLATSEIQIKLDPKFRIGLEYGRSKAQGNLSSLSFIFNL